MTPEPEQAGTIPNRYFLTPVASEQVERSRQMILLAAEAVSPRSAAVLGAGNCAEIPVAELAERFERLLVNDADAAMLEQGLAAAGLSDAARAKLEVRVSDLTGATDPLVQQTHDLLSAASDPAKAVDEMAALVDGTELPGAGFAGRYDLIVASCVLCQLHLGLVHRTSNLFVSRFPSDAALLRSSSRWTQALYDMARRMETRFLDDLAEMLAPGGLIFLSATAQMCDIRLNQSGQWATAGTYRMLRSQQLTDYVDARFAVVTQGRWHWVVSPPERAGDTGRLFDVQAVVLAAGRQARSA